VARPSLLLSPEGSGGRLANSRLSRERSRWVSSAPRRSVGWASNALPRASGAWGSRRAAPFTPELVDHYTARHAAGEGLPVMGPDGAPLHAAAGAAGGAPEGEELAP
jgi:hypothetical protein